MTQSISPQHPAVVLRSQYIHLRALLVAAIIAVACLAAGVVALAVDNSGSGSSVSAPASLTSPTAPDQRYDGGPEEGTRGRFAAPAAPNFGGSR
jgi:hypothetical protein